MVLETDRIYAIGTAAEDTAIKAFLPNEGAAINWASATGWTKQTFEFNEDPFEFNKADQQRLNVKAPASPTKTKVIRNNVAIDTLVFTSYEIGAKVLALCTNASEGSGGEWTFSTTHTRKALAIEYYGVACVWFPSVEIEADVPVGAAWQLSTQTVMIDVFGTDSYPTGYAIFDYVAA